MEMQVSFKSDVKDIQKALDEVNLRFAEMEDLEPRNESSAEHKKWEAECEELAEMSETLMTWIDRKIASSQGF